MWHRASSEPDGCRVGGRGRRRLKRVGTRKTGLTLKRRAWKRASERVEATLRDAVSPSEAGNGASVMVLVPNIQFPTRERTDKREAKRRETSRRNRPGAHEK